MPKQPRLGKIIRRATHTADVLPAGTTITPGNLLGFAVNMEDYHDLWFNIGLTSGMIRAFATTSPNDTFVPEREVVYDGKPWEADMLTAEKKAFHITDLDTYAAVYMHNTGSVDAVLSSDIVNKS